MRCCSKLFNLMKALLPFGVMCCVIVLFHFTDIILFKYYPVVVNFLLFAVFFGSVFQKETVIQKIARAMEPDIKPKALEYTRKLTYIWSAFMFCNFVVSLLTVFLSEKIWIVYNGFVSYLLVGFFFGVEYIVRINFKRKHDC